MSATRRQPGEDDDRKPTQCLTCGLVGSGEVCPQCMELLSDLDEPEPVPPAPALCADPTSSLRTRLLEGGPAPRVRVASGACGFAETVRNVRAHGQGATTLGSTPDRRSDTS